MWSTPSPHHEVCCNDAAGEVTVGASLEQVANALTVATNKKETNIHTERDTVDAENEHVHVGEVGTTLQAYMYIWTNQNDPDLVGNWDYEVIGYSFLQFFVRHFCYVFTYSNRVYYQRMWDYLYVLYFSRISSCC